MTIVIIQIEDAVLFKQLLGFDQKSIAVVHMLQNTETDDVVRRGRDRVGCFARIQDRIQPVQIFPSGFYTGAAWIIANQL